MKPTTNETGARNEERAVSFLASRGYRIVERNFKTRIGELDIIARDGNILAFVEVRSRASDQYGSALEAVGWGKQSKVSRMAQIYLMWRTPEFDEARFDVVAITGDEITLVKDAWRLGDRC
jgi:putative endonuclease